METLIYFNGGAVCLDCFERTKDEIKDMKTKAKARGHVGYLIGHRYRDGKKDRVIVFFKARPTKAEIQRRRLNGFIGARWWYMFTEEAEIYCLEADDV